MINFSRGFLTVPVAILIAGVIIGLSIVYAVGKQSAQLPTVANVADTFAGDGAQGDIQLRTIDASDHILGDRNAPVKIVAYSDPECPFCKRFHSTMQQLITEYDGKVAWVYRAFPLDSLHPKARKESEAVECAGAQGGNDKFWAYLDRLMEVTPSNNQLDLAELPRIAQFVGLDVSSFSTCLATGAYAPHVDADYADAVRAGGQGTPYSVIVSANGKTTPINGALPYSAVKTLIDEVLSE